MGEGKSPSASGHQSVTAVGGKRSGFGGDPGASVPTLKLSSFSACQHHSVNTFCVCVSLRLTPKEVETIDVGTQRKKEPYRLTLLKQGSLQLYVVVVKSSWPTSVLRASIPCLPLPFPASL